jgi:hypothetical protein
VSVAQRVKDLDKRTNNRHDLAYPHSGSPGVHESHFLLSTVLGSHLSCALHVVVQFMELSLLLGAGASAV